MAVYLQNNWRDYSRGKSSIQLKTDKTPKNTNFKPDNYFIPNLVLKNRNLRNYK
jgi:hypothetical protein